MKFDRYEVMCKEDGTIFRLGQSPTSSSYKALDLDLQVPVVLKVIRSELLEDETARKRFLREARAAALVRHPHVAQIYRLGEFDGAHFYAREFVEGETIETMVNRDGPMPVAESLRVAIDVAEALIAVKKVGLVHRDIKPSNLMMMPDGMVKIIDFGLAKNDSDGRTDALGSLTLSGFVGTPEYASPEQLNESDLDVASDIYSLGCTLWFMLTGRPPFRGATAQVMAKHLQSAPPFEELSHLPASLTSLLAHTLEKEPSRRPGSPSQFVEMLKACASELQGQPVNPVPQLKPASAEPFKKMTAARQPAVAQPERSFLLREVLVGAVIAAIIYFVLTRPLPSAPAPSSEPVGAETTPVPALAGGSQ